MHKSIVTLLLVTTLATPAHAERVKDLASVAGVRTNQLIGYGLVVGLDGTGDQTSQAPFTIQSIRTMLAKFGVTIPDNVNPQLKNVAAVTVTADLPPFSKAGQTVDVTVASIGNAQSLRGGTLIMTPLRGADGQVYAIAQGSMLVSGFGVSGKDGSRIAVNVPSGGRIPNGATVEREVGNQFGAEPFVMLNLHTPDFSTASRLAAGIDGLLGAGTAEALDAVSVRVAAPQETGQRTAFLAVLEELEVQPGEAPARVIVNSPARSSSAIVCRCDRPRWPTGRSRSRSRSASMSASRIRSAVARRSACSGANSRSRNPRRACSCSMRASTSMKSCGP